jgi:MFS family permease
VLSNRLNVLRLRDFRVFAIGYTTSTVGTAMSSVALAFAVLGSGGSPSTLSVVLAARILPMLAVLPTAGVLGDRFSRRWVMIWADCGNCLVVGALGLAFLAGRPSLWLLLGLSVLSGLGEAVFRPSLNGLVPELVPADRRQEANALLGLVQSAASVAGPAIAGVLAVAASPAVVLLVDAVSYLPSVAALLLLRTKAIGRGGTTTMYDDLRAGWRIFRSLPWLWAVTLQFTLFNVVTWAPYLVLGPVTAARSYGGARAWGIVLAIYGAGAIVGGLVALLWRPRRPLVAATAVGLGWAAPSAALAAAAPLIVVGVAAFTGGLVSSIHGTLWTTTVQQRIPAEAMSRVNSLIVLGAFSVGPIGLALAGPAAQATSVATVLAVGVGWHLLANAVLLSTSAIRDVSSVRTATPLEVPYGPPGSRPGDPGTPACDRRGTSGATTTPPGGAADCAASQRAVTRVSRPD